MRVDVCATNRNENNIFAQQQKTTATAAMAKDSKCLFSWRITKFSSLQSRKDNIHHRQWKFVVSTFVFDIHAARLLVSPRDKEASHLWSLYLLHSLFTVRPLARCRSSLFLPSLVHLVLCERSTLSRCVVVSRVCFFFIPICSCVVCYCQKIMRQIPPIVTEWRCGFCFALSALLSIAIIRNMYTVWIWTNARATPTFCVFSMDRNRFLCLFFFLSVLFFSLVVFFHLDSILVLLIAVNNIFLYCFFSLLFCSFFAVFPFFFASFCCFFATFWMLYTVLASQSQCFSIVFHGSTLSHYLKIVFIPGITLDQIRNSTGWKAISIFAAYSRSMLNTFLLSFSNSQMYWNGKLRPVKHFSTKHMCFDWIF